MPWKLVSFLCTLVMIALFIGFNLENRCDISFIFFAIRDVPIFVSLLFAYVVGAITVIPFFIVSRRNRKNGGVTPASNGKSTGAGKTRTAHGRKTGGPANPRYYDID